MAIGASHRASFTAAPATAPGVFRAAFLRRLRDERGGHAATATSSSNATAADAVREASRLFPAAWVRKAGPLTVRATPQSSSWRGLYDAAHKTAWVDGSLDNAVHEYTHHLQAMVPGFQRVFREIHLRRTTTNGLRDPIETKGGYKGVRTDAYIDAYMGKDYQTTFAGMVGNPDLSDGDALELAPRVFQILFDSLNGKEMLDDLASKDAKLLDLAIGMLFTWDP